MTGMTNVTKLASEPSGQEFLVFTLGDEEYGIDILKVQEIRGYDQVTRIANTPEFIKGVTNLRGVIVPILDMRLKFNMSDVAYDSQTVTIVLSLAKQVVGIVVDAVSDVVELKGEDIKPAPDFTGAIDTQQVIGIATIEQDQRQRMLILIDIEKLMSSAEMGLISQNEVAA